MNRGRSQSRPRAAEGHLEAPAKRAQSRSASLKPMEDSALAPPKDGARSRSRSQVRQPDAAQARSKSRSRAPEEAPKPIPIIGKAGANMKKGGKKGMAPEEDGMLTFLPGLVRD